MLSVTAGYGRFSDFIALFRNFYVSIITSLERYRASSNFYKKCVKAEVYMDTKSKPM